MLLVGIVARTHGNRGEVVVNTTTDFVEERFGAGGLVWGRAPGGGSPEALRVRTFRMHLGRPAVTFGDVETINDAERFAGWELRVPESARQALPEHVYYQYDLIGCTVVTVAGEEIGPVKAVDGDGQVRLVIAAPRGEVLVPFTQDFCAVDLAARRIVVRPPEGLLEMNGDWRA
jgi:16S rRNA processing protein RimM